MRVLFPFLLLDIIKDILFVYILIISGTSTMTDYIQLFINLSGISGNRTEQEILVIF